MEDFFVSYASPDRPWAEWIAWALEAEGHTVVIQAWDFVPGSNFVHEMQRAAQRATRTIAVLTAHYLERDFPQAEWAAAFALDPVGAGRRLVPVRVEETRGSGLLSQIVYVDLVPHLGDPEAARRALLDGIAAGRRKPATPPPFPAPETRPLPDGPGRDVRNHGLPRRFIHARIAAEGLLELEGASNPYALPLDATGGDDAPPSGDRASAVWCFLWLPHTDHLCSRRLHPFTPAVALCTPEPTRLANELRDRLDRPAIERLRSPPRNVLPECRRELLTAIATVTQDSFLAAVAVPALLLGIGQNRAEFAYQAFVDLFLAPLAVMHRRLRFASFHLRVAPVGERSKFVLRSAKVALREPFPGKGARSVDLAGPESGEWLLISAGRLIAWAIAAYYNRGDAEWLGLLEKR